MAQPELCVRAEEIQVSQMLLRTLVQTHLLSKHVLRARFNVMRIMSLSLAQDVVQMVHGRRVEVVDPFSVRWMMFRPLETVRVSRPR